MPYSQTLEELDYVYDQPFPPRASRRTEAVAKRGGRLAIGTYSPLDPVLADYHPQYPGTFMAFSHTLGPQRSASAPEMPPYLFQSSSHRSAI